MSSRLLNLLFTGAAWLALAAAGVLLSLPSHAQEDGGEDCVTVEMQEAWQEDLEVTLHGTGSLRPWQEVMITPETAGRVQEIHFREGQRVERGDLLVTLDSTKLEMQLRAAEASLREAQARKENARRNYQRQQSLYDRGVGSEEARDESRTAYEQARAQVDRLRAEIEELEETISDTRIRAPFHGELDERRIDVGDYVSPGTAMVQLVQTDRLELRFNLPERHLARAETGQQANFRVAAYPEETFTGRVEFINPLVQETTRNIRIKAAVDNPQGELRPGMYASARLIVDRREKATVIPEEALVSTRTGFMVFSVSDSRASYTEVEIGMRKPGLVEVRQGLEPGQKVITSGHIAVGDGDRVCEPQRAASGQ